ncbi:MAG: serine/threonine-protein kinase [Polyangiales bacterium]
MLTADEPRNTPRDAPRAVRALGRYEVSRQLGEGAMGRVYLAHDPELGRDVAVKVLRLEAAGTAKSAFIARFRNEARAAARFNHPNVVSVYDAGVDAAHGPYVVYELVAGENLRRVLERGPMDRSELLNLARGVASALDAMHGAQILHRDVKPDNILIAPDGAVKITDFGIARVPDAALTRDGQFLGTPAYAPPEAITKGEYSARGDVWSLAAVLYEALTGVRPFPGDDAVAVSYAVVNDTVLPPTRVRPDLPAGLDEVFVRAFARRPQERFPSAIELANNLTAAFVNPRGSATATMTLGARRPQHPDLARRASAPPPPRGAVLLVGAIVLTLLVLLARRGRQPAPAPQVARIALAPPRVEAPPAAAARAPAPRRATTARVGVTPRRARHPR